MAKITLSPNKALAAGPWAVVGNLAKILGMGEVKDTWIEIRRPLKDHAGPDT